MAEPAHIRRLKRRVNKARNFPENTCGSSRHVHMMADALAAGETYHMFTDEPEHCAYSLYAVIASLWEARTELAKLKGPEQVERERAAAVAKATKHMRARGSKSVASEQAEGEA